MNLHSSWRILGAAFALSMVWAIGACRVQGTTIVDAGGFEQSAGYNSTFLGSGQLEGQPPANPWLRTVGGTSSAVVQDMVAASGSQAVQVDRHPNSDARWAIPLFGWPSQPIVVIDWDMRVSPTLAPAGSFGPFFGVEAYDTDGLSGGVGLFGSLGVDAATGDVLYQAQTTGYLTETGVTVAFDQWNSFRIILDVTLDSYAVFLNGAHLATTGFVDGGGLEQLTDADISTFGAAGDPVSQGLAGQGFFDNFLVRQYPDLAAVPPQHVIPEPASMMLAALSGGILLRIRRRVKS